MAGRVRSPVKPGMTDGRSGVRSPVEAGDDGTGTGDDGGDGRSGVGSPVGAGDDGKGSRG